MSIHTLTQEKPPHGIKPREAIGLFRTTGSLLALQGSL